MKHFFLAALALSACGTLIGHDKQENTYSALEGSHTIQTQREDIVLSEVELQDAVSKRVDGRLQVQFAFQNTASYKVRFEYQVRWFNGTDEAAFSTSPWIPTTLDPNASKPKTVTAPTPTSIGWQIATRAPHTSN